MVPVAGVEPRAIRNSFSDPRSGGRTHRAYDIAAPRGTPVVAAMGGRVLAKRNNALGGISMYVVDHDREFVYYYAHLDRYARGVNEGDDVQQGRVLGYVGTTGNAPASFPHLHFQVLRVDPRRRDWWNGPAVDVLDYFALTGSDGSR